MASFQAIHFHHRSPRPMKELTLLQEPIALTDTAFLFSAFGCKFGCRCCP
jgi:hypothetical protein